MTKTTSTLALVLALLCQLTSSAEAVAGQYKLRVQINTFREYTCEGDSCTRYIAPEDSRFVILSKDDDKVVVMFKGIPADASRKDSNKYVRKDGLYRISTGELKEFTYRMYVGIDHGPLIVPFKLRSHNNTITGESTLGYYFGVTTKWLIVSSTLFTSAGLAVIPISDVNSGSNENRTGVSYSIGMSVETTDRFQTAIVVGWDYLGGEAGRRWEFEGNPWYSFAIGFRFAGGGK